MSKTRKTDDRIPAGGADDGIDDNLPGFAYAQRVVTAWSNALTAMGEGFNQGWSDIQQGNYGFRALMKTWASTWTASFDVLLELWKGPNFRTAPQWLHFRLVKSGQPSGARGKTAAPAVTPDVLEGTLPLDKKWGRDVELETMAFERLGAAGPAAASATALSELWSTCAWTDDLRRDSLDIALDVKVAATLAPGQYLGIVLASGTTGEPPLAVVMLQVTG